MKHLSFLLCVCAGALFGEECAQTFMNGSVGVCTPPASPTTEGISTFIRGDFLYWIARQDGLEYDFLSGTLLPNQVMEDVSVREADFEWTPALRLSLGARLPRDDWEFKGVWTRFFTSASQSTQTTNGLLNNGVWNDGVSIVESADTTQMSANWSLHYNLLDFGFSRSYFLGKNLSADLSFGGAGVWIHQRLNVFEENASPASIYYTTIPTEVNLQPKLKSSYNAGGLFLKASPEWHLSPSWSLLGTFGTYIVHGSFQIDQTWVVAALPDGDLQIHKSLQRTRVGLQSALGVQWQTSPRNEKWHVALAAQYEGTYWFKQNLFSQVNTTFGENYERRSDLEMQGVSVSARFDF